MTQAEGTEMQSPWAQSSTGAGMTRAWEHRGLGKEWGDI